MLFNNGAFHKIKYIIQETLNMQPIALPVFLNSTLEA